MYWFLTENYVLNANISVFMLIHTELFFNVSGLGHIHCGLGLEKIFGPQPRPHSFWPRPHAQLASLTSWQTICRTRDFFGNVAKIVVKSEWSILSYFAFKSTIWMAGRRKAVNGGITRASSRTSPSMCMPAFHTHFHEPQDKHRERKCAKNIINNTINSFFKLQSAFW